MKVKFQLTSQKKRKFKDYNWLLKEILSQQRIRH